MAQLNGRLNRDVTSANYGGVDTSSVRMHVDNDKMTISADVVWGDILGQTPDKAYPGNLGALNHNKIQQLASDLITEIERSKQAERDLQQYIDSIDVVNPAIEQAVINLKQSVYNLDNLYNVLLSRISSEITRAINSEQELSDAISTELHQREVKDVELAENIETLQVAVETRMNSMESDLTEESRRAEEAEHFLRVEILHAKDKSSEDIRAVKDDLTTLREDVEGNSEAIESNTSTIDSVKDELQSVSAKLQSHTTALDTTDRRLTTLESSIPEISNSVTDISDNLTQAIDDVSARVSNLDDSSVEQEQKISDIVTSLSELRTDVDDRFETATSDLLSANVALSDQIDAVESSIRSDLDSLGILIEEIQTNSATNTQLSGLSDSFNEYKELNDISVRSLQQSLTEQDSALSRLGSTVSIINDSVQSLSSDTESLLNKSNSAQERIESLESEIASLRTIPEDLGSFEIEAVANFEATALELAALKSHVENNESSFVARLDAQSASHSADVEALTDLLHSEDAKLTDAISDVSDAVDEHIEDSASEFSNIEMAIYDHEEDLQILRHDLNSAQASFITRQDALESSMTSRDNELSGDIEELSEYVSTVDEELSSVITSVSSLSNKQAKDVNDLTESIQSIDSYCKTAVSNLLIVNNTQQETIDATVTDVAELKQADEELSGLIDSKHNEAIAYADSKFADIDTLVDESFGEHFKIRIIDGGNAPI